ncbi:MAG: hypothetical protein AB1925_12575 [Actinomycetota bacterium]
MSAATKVRTFYISTDPINLGLRFWFILRVYPTTKMLQAAAAKYSPGEDFTNAGGVFHGRFSSWRDKETGKLSRHPSTSFIGVMRLSRQNLHPHVVIHESTHAAVTLVQAQKLVTELRLGRTREQMDHTEEPLCHAVHEISRAVLRATGFYA